MYTASFLVVTAVMEAATGVALIFDPAVPIGLLLGIEGAAKETLVVGRVASAALIALGVASGMSRNAETTSVQQGLLTGLLIYDGSAAAMFAHAGLALQMAGAALWPAVVLHLSMAGWCISCLMNNARGRK